MVIIFQGFITKFYPRRWQAYPRFCYTAISIYVVGSKLQGYGTRPKGGMGRLELILGFRGCRREMDMDIGDLRCMDEALLILLIIIH